MDLINTREDSIDVILQSLEDAIEEQAGKTVVLTLVDLERRLKNMREALGGNYTWYEDRNGSLL
jgi:hypothetical protein